jgi:hypothetical protein
LTYKLFDGTDNIIVREISWFLILAMRILHPAQNLIKIIFIFLNQSRLSTIVMSTDSN